MSEFNRNHQYWDHEDSPGLPLAFDQLELIMRSAGEYVQPTEDLRPKVIEAARIACRQRRTNRRLSGLTLLVLLIGATGLPALLLSAYPSLAVADSAELHRRASRSVVENGTETNWALYEAFSELRREHSALLQHAD